MARRKFVADIGIGSTDMLFNLLLFFFITTVLVAKAPSLADDVAVPGGDSKAVPVVVRLDGAPTDDQPARFSLKSAGNVAAPPAELGIGAWLKQVCDVPATGDDKPTPVVVQIECPDDVTHAQCKRGVRDLWLAAPACQYQY